MILLRCYFFLAKSNQILSNHPILCLCPEKTKEEEEDDASSIISEEESTGATTATLHDVKKISLNKSSSTTTTERSSSDWMDAFRLIYQLLFVSNALIQLAAFINRFRNMRMRRIDGEKVVVCK